MKKMMKMIQRIKKSNDKGFSLVELIIVISIMAILLGVVGTQVLPYLNKSKESNDNQLLSKFHTAAVSAFAFNADAVTGGTYKITIKSGSTDSITGGLDDTVLKEWHDLIGVSGSAFTYFHDNASSPNGQKVNMIVITHEATGAGKTYIKAYTGSTETPADQVLKTIESK